jgi:hypothetical protein
MRRGLMVVLISAAAALACSDDASPTGPDSVTLPVEFDHERNHRLTRLSGAEEVPQRNTSATGQARFHVAADGRVVAYELFVENIDNVFQAHIHLAPAGQNGGIVVWLYPSTAPTPGPLGAGRIRGRIAQGTITEENLVGALTGNPLSALIDAVRSGNAYVNVHTNDGVPPADTGPGDFPGGEIRGQIP